MDILLDVPGGEEGARRGLRKGGGLFVLLDKESARSISHQLDHKPDLSPLSSVDTLADILS